MQGTPSVPPRFMRSEPTSEARRRRTGSAGTGTTRNRNRRTDSWDTRGRCPKTIYACCIHAQPRAWSATRWQTLTFPTSNWPPASACIARPYGAGQMIVRRASRRRSCFRAVARAGNSPRSTNGWRRRPVPPMFDAVTADLAKLGRNSKASCTALLAIVTEAQVQAMIALFWGA